MQKSSKPVSIETALLNSSLLDREVQVDFYRLFRPGTPPVLLLVNDGQNLEEMGVAEMITALQQKGNLPSILVAGLHAGEQRKREYGVATEADYLGRGDLAGAYSGFVTGELLPFIHAKFGKAFVETVFAGFSLGGLSAFDIVWNHPHLFRAAGVFSGSLWWRSLAQEDPGYSDDQHRIIHRRVRQSEPRPGLRFYLQCGNMDEVMDRNHNGIIDSIDDTLGLIRELEGKGYRLGAEIHFREIVDGKHDVATWARALPEFLVWAFGKVGSE